MVKFELEYVNKAWQNAIASAKYFSKRIRSDKEIEQYWNRLASNYDENVTDSDVKRVDYVLDLLKRENYLTGDSRVLDLASGTGIYTIPIAKVAKSVTAIDSSSKMCSILKDKANAENIHNINIINDFWEDINLKDKKLYKSFDLVISSLNPSIKDLEALTKINDVSSKACCLIYFAGPVYNPTRKDLWKLLLDIDYSAKGNDIIYPYSILYNLGYYPKMDYIDITWATEKTKKRAIEDICNSFWLYMDITNEVKNKIDYYVSEKMEDGIFRNITKAKLGIVSWKTN